LAARGSGFVRDGPGRGCACPGGPRPVCPRFGRSCRLCAASGARQRLGARGPMLNRPTTPWLPDSTPARGWDCDGAPHLRLAIMGLTAFLALSAVGVRLAQLQLVLQEDYVNGFEQTYEVREEIPARQ